MHKKLVEVMISLFLVLILLSGCGSNKNEQENTSDNAAVNDSKSGNVSLRVWGAEEDEELINQIIQAFISENSGSANLSITFEAHSESSCKDEVLGDVLNAPDVFTFADDQLMAFVASGVLKKIDNDTEISGRNLAAASEAASVNGVLYAYPLTADNGYFLFYNKKYLTEDDVATMDGLLKAANACEKKVFMEMNSGWYMYSFFGGTDMQIGLNDDGISTFCNWNAKYTNIKGVDVAEAMLKIAQNPAFTNTSNDGFATGAADGSFVAGVSGVWDENSIKDAWGDDYAAAKLPTYTVAGNQVQMSSYAGYKMVGVNSYSKNKEWAAKFADFMTNEANQTLRFKLRGQGPSNTNASQAGEIAESKALKALQSQSTYASLQRVGGTYWDAASAFGNTICAGNPFGKSLQALLNEMVEGITGEATTGDAEDTESTEAVATEETSTEEVTTEEVTAEESATEETTTEETATDASSEETTEQATDQASEATTEEVKQETEETTKENTESADTEKKEAGL